MATLKIPDEESFDYFAVVVHGHLAYSIVFVDGSAVENGKCSCFILDENGRYDFTGGYYEIKPKDLRVIEFLPVETLKF